MTLLLIWGLYQWCATHSLRRFLRYWQNLAFLESNTTELGIKQHAQIQNALDDPTCQLSEFPKRFVDQDCSQLFLAASAGPFSNFAYNLPTECLTLWALQIFLTDVLLAIVTKTGVSHHFARWYVLGPAVALMCLDVSIPY